MLGVLTFAACGTSGKTSLSEDAFLFWLEHSYESELYMQDRVMLTDAKGDAFLIRQLDSIPLKITSHLFHRSLPQASDQQDSETFRIGRTIPIDNEQLLKQCAETMRQHTPFILPSLGTEHRWSPEAWKYLGHGYWHRLGRRLAHRQKDFPTPMLLRSKLFFCLACGWTSRYCITGTEEALTQRIMNYPDHSLQPHQLFAESYVLNQGNLYMTFLTCENVLAGHPHRKGRQNDPLQKKLSYIRHDSKELGDNYGAWYHFFGIALYGMFRTRFTSVSVADIESMGSYFMEGPDRQETLINHYGALFGYRLRKMIEEGSWKEN